MNGRMMFVLLASGTLLTGPTAAAQQWGYGRAPEAGACFYEAPQFRGRHFCARAGEDLPFIPNGMNDRIMSIRLFGGAKVVVYSWNRFDGRESWFDYDVPDLRYEGWADRISSVRLRWDWREADRESYRDYDRRDGRYDEGRDEGYYEGRPGGYRANAPISQAQAQQVVRSAYLSVLKREPDYPGADAWVNAVMNNHLSQQDLERELRNSDEYKKKNQGR